MLGSEPKKRFHEAVLVPEPSKRFANISNCQKRFFQNFLQIKFTHTRGGFKKTPSFHQSFKTLGDIQKPGENLVIFGKKHQVLKNHHVFNNLFKLGDFSKPGENLVNFEKITRFAPSFWKTTIFKQISPRKHLFFTKIKVKTFLLLIFEGVKRLFWLNFKTWWKPGDF